MQGIHLELTAAMKAVIREKFAVLLRHTPWIIRLNVRLHQDQTLGTEHHYTATGEVEIGGPNLIATAEGKEAYTVLDDLVDTLERLLRERHGRWKDKRNHPHGVDVGGELPKLG